MSSVAEILSPDAKTPVDDDARDNEVEAGDERISVADLVLMFEESEDATQTSRALSERDRDYTDNIQLTAEEKKALKKRGQPEVIINRIKRKIDYLVGLEKQQRVLPKAMPRTPMHDQDADSATQALRYVAECESYGQKRSAVWRNLLVEGAGGIGVAVEPSKYQPKAPGAPQTPTQFGTEVASFPLPAVPGQQQYDVKYRRIAWDRMFADPHSSELDYSDATYLGVVLWMDFGDAKVTYKDNPDAADILNTTMTDAAHSTTYDDKPKFRLWADKKRKRVRIVQIWLKRGDDWFFAEFTKGGILKAGPSPYKTDTGQSDCELIFQSCYVNRENERYGIVREMISPQDEVNKRRSKALHLLNTNQVVYEEGAIEDIELFRRNANRADGTMKVNPGGMNLVKFETRLDLAEAQFKLLQESKNEIDLMGPNATMEGDAGAGGGGAASGKAIIASQQGGMVSIGDIMDSLRHLDNRVFRATWYRVRQFWTAEKWIRVTDDERNVKWVGLNTNMEVQKDPQTGQAVTTPRLGPDGQPMPPTMLAELDCDITIDEAPDSVTPQLEQWQGLVELAKAGVQIPPRILIKSAPNLKNKDAILQEMEQPNAGAQQAEQFQQMMQQIQAALGQAKVADTQASAKLKEATAAAKIHEINAPPDQPQAPDPGEPLGHEQALADLMNTVADTDLKRANTDLVESKTRQTAVATHLAPAEFAARRSDAATRAAQPPPQAA